MLDSNMLTAYS